MQQPPHRPRYNGNISEWEWQQGSGTPTQYAFTYDGVNRLSSASYYTQTGGAWTLSDKYAEKIPSYDRNGNITKLIRTSQTGSPVTLNYAYSGNKLTALSGSLTGSYTYDVNGNMINDSRKALNIKYNSLNLLSSVNNGQAKYSYLADGTKLRVRNSADTEGFDYLGSLIYRCDASGLNLESVSFGDGRIVKNSVQPTVQYFQTDHLGSIRTIVDGATGSVLERNDYYPFGSKHIRTDYALASNPTNRFLFNGKEKQVTGGLNFLDYGWRMYDEEVGRWFGMDKMAEKYMTITPYSFCLSNPLKFIDPNGLDVIRNENGSITFNGDDLVQYWGNLQLALEGKTSWDNFYEGIEQAADSEDHRFLNLGETINIKGSKLSIPGWEFSAGLAGTITSELYFSKKYNTWMGKNFKLYSQNWGGNKFTGGKNRFAKATSNKITWAGRGLGFWNMHNINTQLKNNEITNTQWGLEQTSNLYSTLGGINGAAWSIGWELGRTICSTRWYQNLKFNLMYNYWESQIGAPSQSNEYLWNYFYQNYRP